MDTSNSLLFDVINILPEGVDCEIQAPSLEDEVLLHLMRKTEFEDHPIKLEGENKKVFLERIKCHPVEEFFNRVEIKLCNKTLFEGYDGVEFGVISKTIELPNWFIDKYIKKDLCIISNEW